MHTTGSRGLPAMRSNTLRLIVGAALLLALAGLLAAFAGQASAGPAGKITVNTTANTDDGQCNGPPNNNVAGSCTLHEAIDFVNAGNADVINFHPTIFSKTSPGVIQLDVAQGDLPEITREVVIDNTGTGVILDCDQDNDQSWECDSGLSVRPSHNGFDFTLLGGKNFVIREIDGDGINIDGDEECIKGICSLGNVLISGVIINVDDNETDADGDDGIDVEGVSNINNLVITNSNVTGDDENEADNGVDIDVLGDGDNDLTNNNITITENTIFGGDGVDVDIDGDLFSPEGLNGIGHKALVLIEHNDSIIGNGGDGVEVNYCEDEGGDCDARNSQINFHVINNGKIASNDDDDDDGDAVDMDIVATRDGCAPACNDNVTVNADVDGNAIVDGDDDDAVRINIDICCATSDSTANVSVSNNQDIVGDEDGVEVDAIVGEGPDNTIDIDVDNNGEITGEGDSGIDINVLAGSNTEEDVDADENEVRISIAGNDNISGDDDDGIDVDAVAGKNAGDGDADRNLVEVIVDNNDDIDGDDDGVDVDARAGTREGPGDADDNDVMIRIINNGDIDGADDEGIDIDATAGHIEDDDEDPNVTGDGNATDVLIDNNDNITGHDGHGIEVESFSGALESTGENDTTNVVIQNNGEIEGNQAGNDGIHLESGVCCDSENTNTIDINNNDNIIGQDADGIDVDELCCSINFIFITDNQGNIKGNDDNGIEITPCLDSGDPEDPASTEEEDVECMGETVTQLIITGNQISDSGEDGIIVCCGSFQLPGVQAPPAIAGAAILKSLIANNTISHNGEDGIDLDTVIGMNIEHNEIFMNGTSVQDGDNGVEIDWQFAFFIFEDSGELVKIPSHYNRISENSIYDNVGLGINLIGTDPNDTDGPPQSGNENGEPADGVSCTAFTLNLIAANDCLPIPKLLFTGPGDKLTGTACSRCHVEVFLADDTPADQTGPLNRQHGEGKVYLVTVEADQLGNFSVDLPCDLDPGILTATSTDKVKNTSEFASNVPFPGTSDCATPTPTVTDTPVATDTPTPAPPTDTATPAPPTNTPVPPTNTPVPPTATPAKPCGDVNDDGLVNAVDAELILQFRVGLINTLPNMPSGDVNSDGQVTAVDAALILQQVAALIPPGSLVCP